MEILTLGISHKTAPVQLRERLALTETRMTDLLRDLHGASEIQEVVALSTCNRTELYLVAQEPVEAEAIALGLLARQSNLRLSALASSIYSLRNCDAARHLYRVTAGLESMIVGEDQVQGQVKRAYEQALQSETTGPMTNQLFRAALFTGKRVRAETAISAGQISLPSVSAMLAREQLGDLAGRTVVMVGTGESSRLAARALAEAGPELVFVAARHRDRAVSLAQSIGGRSASLEDLPKLLGAADVVVSATSSPQVMIDAAELGEIHRRRGSQPLLLIDLAVPRDIDPECAKIPGVTLADVDDLQGVVARNRRVRQLEAVRAEGIIEQEIQNFATWLGSLEVLPTLVALRKHGDLIAEQVLAENRTQWETASERDLERVEALARAIVKRLLHHPTLSIRELGDERVHARMALVRDLFGLSVDEDAALEAAPLEPSDITLLRSLPEREP
ncbi:MAG: glutamyl-tRNA reductase [Solirubrobacteraceae bacterium]